MNRLHIACIAEGAYFRHAGAMLHSVFAHTPGPIVVHLLHERSVPAADRDAMQALFTDFDAQLDWQPIGDEAAAEFRDGYFPRAIWFRVLLPDLLPALDRVLYLDADLIACDNLRGLWDTDLRGHLLGAVCNPFFAFMEPYPEQALGIADPADYLNSGVLLMDLARMRAQNSSAALVEVARSRPELHYPDQDALNIVCRGRWLALDPRWNLQTTILQNALTDLPLDADRVQAAREHPGLVHYIGPFKPWTYMCRHPLRHLYFEHARRTAWGEPKPEGRNLRTMLLRPLPFRWQDRWMALERMLGTWLAGLARRLRRRLRARRR